jgi:hypothetical protein
MMTDCGREPIIAVSFFGSPQESDGPSISSRFSEDDEFGLSGGHALSLEQQIAKVPIGLAPKGETTSVLTGFLTRGGKLTIA